MDRNNFRNIGGQFYLDDSAPFEDGSDEFDLSMPGCYHDPLLAPTTYPPPSYPSPAMRSPMQLSPYYQQASNATTLNTRQSYATVARGGAAAPIGGSLQTNSGLPISTQVQQGRKRPRLSPEVFDSSIHQAYHQQTTPQTRQQTYAEAVRSPQIQYSMPGSNRRLSSTLSHQQRDLFRQQMHSVGTNGWCRPNATIVSAFQGHTTQNTVQEQVPYPARHVEDTEHDFSTNANWQPGIAESLEGVRAWADQPRATGDRTRPLLNTWKSNQLSDHTHESSNPMSSAPSSGTSRRNRDEITSGNYEFICEQCSAGFDALADLNHHYRSHIPYGERKHVCDVCGYRFIYAKDLRRHKLRHNPNAPRLLCPFTNCRYATEGFKREDHYDRHVRSHYAVESAPQSSYSSSLYEA